MLLDIHEQTTVESYEKVFGCILIAGAHPSCSSWHLNPRLSGSQWNGPVINISQLLANGSGNCRNFCCGRFVVTDCCMETYRRLIWSFLNRFSTVSSVLALPSEVCQQFETDVTIVSVFLKQKLNSRVTDAPKANQNWQAEFLILIQDIFIQSTGITRIESVFKIADCKTFIQWYIHMTRGKRDG